MHVYNTHMIPNTTHRLLIMSCHHPLPYINILTTASTLTRTYNCLCSYPNLQLPLLLPVLTTVCALTRTYNCLYSYPYLQLPLLLPVLTTACALIRTYNGPYSCFPLLCSMQFSSFPKNFPTSYCKFIFLLSTPLNLYRFCLTLTHNTFPFICYCFTPLILFSLSSKSYQWSGGNLDCRIQKQTRPVFWETNTTTFLWHKNQSEN